MALNEIFWLPATGPFSNDQICFWQIHSELSGWSYSVKLQDSVMTRRIYGKSDGCLFACVCVHVRVLDRLSSPCACCGSEVVNLWPVITLLLCSHISPEQVSLGHFNYLTSIPLLLSHAQQNHNDSPGNRLIQILLHVLQRILLIKTNYMKKKISKKTTK